MTRPPLRSISPGHPMRAARSEISGTGAPVEKDGLLCEIFDLTPDKRRSLLMALRRATDPVDFLNAGLDALAGTHVQEKRAEVAAAFADCTVRRGRDISKGDSSHFDCWHFVLSPWLDVLTLRGLVLGLERAAGLHPDDIEALVRRHLGPEKER